MNNAEKVLLFFGILLCSFLIAIYLFPDFRKLVEQHPTCCNDCCGVEGCPACETIKILPTLQPIIDDPYAILSADYFVGEANLTYLLEGSNELKFKEFNFSTSILGNKNVINDIWRFYCLIGKEEGWVCEQKLQGRARSRGELMEAESILRGLLAKECHKNYLNVSDETKVKGGLLPEIPLYGVDLDSNGTWRKIISPAMTITKGWEGSSLSIISEPIPC